MERRAFSGLKVPEEFEQHLRSDVSVLSYFCKPHGFFPNNPQLPLLIYQRAFSSENDFSFLNKLFEGNSWRKDWEWTIFDYAHYHSTAHELLTIVRGSADFQFEGPQGLIHTVSKGDVIAIPAGVAHRCVEDRDLWVVGAYPRGQSWDVVRGESTQELLEAVDRIVQVP